MRYLIDTSIWIDLYENRKGFNNEPLGDYARKLFTKILKEQDQIIKTELLIRELESNYSVEQINGMFSPFERIAKRVHITKEQEKESEKIAMLRKVPKGDALHAILAHDHKLILVTRDNHFKELKDISKYYKPEDLI